LSNLISGYNSQNWLKPWEEQAVFGLVAVIGAPSKKEARQMLAEIYGWFAEEFDTVDLQEAKVLLQELS
jgi:hypothetical protein